MDTLVTDTYDFNNAKKIQNEMKENELSRWQQIKNIYNDEDRGIFGKIRDVAASFGSKEGEGRNVLINVGQDARFGGRRKLRRLGGPRQYAGGGFDFNVNTERRRMHDYDRSGGTADQYEKMRNTPWKEQLDNIQTGLSVGGLTPGVGIFADGLNTVISGGRSLSNLVTGNWDDAGKHALNTGVNLMTMAPAFGQAVAGTKLTTQAIKQANNLTKADNAVDLVKAANVNTVQPFINAAKGDKLYQAKALGKTVKGDKLA